MLTELDHNLGDVFADQVIPEDPALIPEAFATWVQVLGKSDRRVVILLDGLDELAPLSATSSSASPSASAIDVEWLPAKLPRNVRLVLTASYAAVAHNRAFSQMLAARRWDASMMVVRPLSGPDLTRLVGEYLAVHAKSLSPDQVSAITAQPAAGVPLYAKTLLEELRVFGEFETLRHGLLGSRGEGGWRDVGCCFFIGASYACSWK